MNLIKLTMIIKVPILINLDNIISIYYHDGNTVLIGINGDEYLVQESLNHILEYASTNSTR